MEEVIDFKAVDHRGRNCVMEACNKGDLDRIKYLIEKGGSLDVVDNNECSCLHIACRRKHVDVVKYLLDEGIDANVEDNTNDSCLHFACYGFSHASIYILEMLLNAGADVNAHNTSGSTPFMYLCMYGTSSAIKVLLDAGADWRVPDNFDEFGIDYARSCNEKEVVIWLEEYIKGLEKSIENCKTATITVLCVGKRKEEMKTLNLNKDVVNIIAKMLWKTRREVEVWGKMKK